nr:hypothetical protein [Tanacetum cinerariifolium]
MPLGHADSVITEQKTLTNTHDITDVGKLSQFVVKLPDIPEGVLVLSGLSRVWKNPSCDSALRDSKNAVMRRACEGFVTLCACHIGEVQKSSKRKKLVMTKAATESGQKQLFDGSSVGEDDDNEVYKDVVNLDDDVNNTLHVTLITYGAKLPSRWNQAMEDSDPSGADNPDKQDQEEAFGHVDELYSNDGIGQSNPCSGTDPHVVRPSSTAPDAVGYGLEFLRSDEFSQV